MLAGRVQGYSVGEAASVLGVSTDTVRRWVDGGQLAATRSAGGRRHIDGVALAEFARSLHDARDPSSSARQSARNRFPGIVTDVVKDTVMAQVELQAGPFRIVALVSREAVEDMGIRAGVIVDAVVKATNVVVEMPEE